MSETRASPIHVDLGGPRDEGAPELVDLAAERVGGRSLLASDEFFAPKERLLLEGPPITRDEYTEHGKFMDGWETRRSFGRVVGHTHDWCIVALGLPGRVRGLCVDTSHFKGNFPERCALDALAWRGPQGDLDALAQSGLPWVEVLEPTVLRGDHRNMIVLDDADASFDSRAGASASYLGEGGSLSRTTHVRLRIFPDGGVARLRVFGVVAPDWEQITLRAASSGAPVDLAAIEHGGVVLACNDMFFGSRHNLIMPGRARNMGDGWETKRKRREGSDWVIVQLGRRGIIEQIEVDTYHFKGNHPESCAISATDLPRVAQGALADDALPWRPLLERTKLGPHALHTYRAELLDSLPVTHLRLTIHPDGGVSRLRVYGTPI